MRKMSKFPIGEENVTFKDYFIGKSYLAPISNELISIANVTFEPGCRNNWHIHHSKNGGGQILICIFGEGIYQERGKDPIFIKEGDVISIKPGVKHWHGATKNSYFQHLAIEVPGEENKNEWLEPADEKEYEKINHLRGKQ